MFFAKEAEFYNFGPTTIQNLKRRIYSKTNTIKYPMMHYSNRLRVTLMTIIMKEQDGSTVLLQPFVRR